ncbi:MAG: adenylyl-sulfate kinase [Spirochaetaceae bacterium]|jgi:adenylylsulfate kinase-like enzyme|nr:adenylyl-sulfate kinase [Spirochaetaceae bacterium]
MKSKLVWITGLAGAGKTTVAKQIFNLLKGRFPNTAMIDGDDFREVFDNDLGYDMEDRIKNARRIVKMCRYLCCQDLNVVCATMSLYKEIHEFIYDNFENPLIVYLDIPIEELKKRNKKNLYSSGINVSGIDQNIDEPRHDSYVVKINNTVTPNVTVNKIMERLKIYGTDN